MLNHICNQHGGGEGLNREGGKYLQSKSLLEFAVGPSLGLALLLQSVFSTSNVFEFALHGGNFCSLEISIERSMFKNTF